MIIGKLEINNAIMSWETSGCYIIKILKEYESVQANYF